MNRETYADGVLRARWDGDTRTYTEWDEQGVEVLSRPFTAEENARADAEAAAEAEESNKRTIEAQAAAAKADNAAIIDGADTYLAIASPTNAQIAAQVRSLTQAARMAAQQRNGLIRMALADYSGTD